MKSKPETLSSELSTRRVSRWFAMGFRCAELGRTEDKLPLAQCENDFQRQEMRDGFETGNLKLETGNRAHVQFWLVEGDATGSHEEIRERALGHRF